MKMLSKTITSVNVKPMEYTVKMITVKQFIDDWLPKIDCLPIHQRVDVFNYNLEKSTKLYPSKRQGIVGSIFKGVDISEIKINERTEDERKKYPQQYESIDGGNRKRSIRDFIQNKFPLNKIYNCDVGHKFFKELNEQDLLKFYNFKMRIVVYKHLTPQQKSMIWETTNNSTPVNHQEMLNGMGDIPVANGIRELARLISPTDPNPYHSLFDVRLGNDGKIISEKLTFDPTRLTYDRLVARIWAVCHNGEKPYPCDDAQIEELYNDATIDENRRKTIDKKVRECLNFIETFANVKRSVRRAKLTQEEFIVLMRLYFSYKERWGTFKVNDFEQYFELFTMSYNQFYKKDPSDYGSEMIDGYDKKSKEKRMRCSLFWDNLGKHESMKRWSDTVEWMEHNYLTPEQLIKLNIIGVRDSQRSLSYKDREFLLNRQTGLCFIDGQKLNMKDAEAAHIEAWAKSGPTDLNNTVMIRNIYNKEMGTLNVLRYKELYETDLIAQISI